MSCALNVLILTITAIALAMAQLPPTTTSVRPPPLKLQSCEALDKFNHTDLMEAKTFTKNLDECAKSKNENKTVVATVLVDLVNKLKGNKRELANLTDYPVIMKQISKCASTVTGFNFNVSETRKYFGLSNNTVTFKFEMLECKNSLKLAECVENVYAGQLNATTKNHKNTYMRLFDGTDFYCKEARIQDEDRNSSHYSLPSFTLILGAIFGTFKLVI